jgi:hypothetical protein
MDYVPIQSILRCTMPMDGEGLDLVLKIFIMAMKNQDINREENREERNHRSKNIIVTGSLLVFSRI